MAAVVEEYFCNRRNSHEIEIRLNRGTESGIGFSPVANWSLAMSSDGPYG